MLKSYKWMDGWVGWDEKSPFETFHLYVQVLRQMLQVLEEGDIDDDKKLSSNEFTHVINKAPDFLTTFNIRI